MLKAARLAAAHRLELRVVALPAGQRSGRRARSATGPEARARADRALGRRSCASASSGSSPRGDRATPEGRDRILDELRPVFAELGPGAMREELERPWSAPRRLRAAGRAAAGGQRRAAGRRSPRAAPAGRASCRERTERAFLELCIALPDAGRGRSPSSTSTRVFPAADARRRRRTCAPHRGAAPPRGRRRRALAALLAELAVRAAALAPRRRSSRSSAASSSSRVDRAIPVARAGGSARPERARRAAPRGQGRGRAGVDARARADSRAARVATALCSACQAEAGAASVDGPG